MGYASRPVAVAGRGVMGFEDIENLPRLGVAYADAIITQAKLSIWALRRECPYTSDIPARRRQIKRYAHYLRQVASTLETRA